MNTQKHVEIGFIVIIVNNDISKCPFRNFLNFGEFKILKRNVSLISLTVQMAHVHSMVGVAITFKDH